jgi:hypothetical protein
MTAHDMMYALKHPHPDVQFDYIGDNIITALAKLAKKIKNKFKKPRAPEISQSPIKAAENKQPEAFIQPISTSPMKHNYQTRSQNQVDPAVPTNASKERHTSEGADEGVQPFPKKLSQDNFLDMGSFNQATALGKKHWTNMPMANEVILPLTGEKMEYMALLKDPTLEPLRKRGFVNDMGRLFQGIRDITLVSFLILQTSQKTSKSLMEKLYVIINLTKTRKNGSDLQWEEIYWIILENWQPQPWTSQISKL